MSLFVRMTQTRAGAERLLEAQLIPILAKCDYLDARPEADQSFIGMQGTYYVLPIFTYYSNRPGLIPTISNSTVSSALYALPPACRWDVSYIGNETCNNHKPGSSRSHRFGCLLTYTL